MTWQPDSRPCFGHMVFALLIFHFDASFLKTCRMCPCSSCSFFPRLLFSVLTCLKKCTKNLSNTVTIQSQGLHSPDISSVVTCVLHQNWSYFSLQPCFFGAVCCVCFLSALHRGTRVNYLQVSGKVLLEQFLHFHTRRLAILLKSCWTNSEARSQCSENWAKTGSKTRWSLVHVKETLHRFK